MPLIFSDRFEFEWPVTVRTPADGSFVETKFTGKFVMLDEDKLVAAPEAKTHSDLVQFERNRIKEAWIGWKEGDILDDADPQGEEKPLPVTPANIDRMLRNRHMRQALSVAIAESMLDGGVREKN